MFLYFQSSLLYLRKYIYFDLFYAFTIFRICKAMINKKYINDTKLMKINDGNNLNNDIVLLSVF